MKTQLNPANITDTTNIADRSGILIMGYGLLLGAISLTYGMLLIVELGIFFDSLAAILIMGIMVFGINRTFETMDTNTLYTLIG